MATSFSYAQAAKGQAATTATSLAQSTENLKDSASSTHGDHTTVEADAVKTGPIDDELSRNTGIKAQLASKQESSPAQADANLTITTSAAASVTDSRRDDEDAATESSARRSDKSVRSASASTRVTDEAEPKKGSRKPRKGKASGKETGDESKKDKIAEQEKEKEQPKVELVEAPVPSVNIWMQRQETQAAKTSVTLPATRTESNAPAAVDTWPNSQESKKKNKATDASEAANGAVNGTKPQRKVGGDGDSAARRNGARGSRMVERESRTTEVPPPVGDVTSWPTPETAVKETVKEDKRKPADKIERPEVDDETGFKGRSKDKWERMDFVPTVQFSTPIPSTRGSRGGRGGARGGRDVSSRGGHGTAADKPAGAAAPSKATGEGRERARDGNAPARANSQGPANKRASMDVSKEQRKPAAPAGERVKESNVATDQPGSVRERGEGRGDRGRGGYRGRGGHPGNVPMHTQQASYMGNGNSFGSQGASRQYASPPSHQNGNFAPSYGGSQSRGSRGGRGQANSGNYRGVGGSSNAGRMRQAQTSIGQPQWDYQISPMTPGWYELRHAVIGQLEYYFSVENLVKDTYLRKRMDSQGFVPFDLIMTFARMRDTADPGLVRTFATESQKLDFVAGDDGMEKLRSRHYWSRFVLPVEQREVEAQNAGPAFYYPRSLHLVYQNGVMGDYAVTSPTGFANGTEHSYTSYATEDASGQHNGVVNGVVNGVTNGQLSAQVPEFQPGTSLDQSADAQPLINGSADVRESASLINGTHAQPAEAPQS